MASERYFTWNPVLYFDSVDSAFTGEELRQRTLKFTLEDNARGYDKIEWDLDNRDGALTRPDTVSLGLTIRVRYGYQGNTSRWRTFIVNRVRGGVGVSGRPDPAIGSNESVIRFSGRNRNAPDARRKRSKGAKKRSYNTFRTKKYKGGPSAGVTKYDQQNRYDATQLYDDSPGAPRVFQVRHMSDAVREIGRRCGYPESKIIVADTEDDLASAIIPAGMSYADYMWTQSLDLEWIYKADENALRFYPPGWKGTKERKAHAFDYGGPDILQLTTDWDFQLPAAGKVTGVSVLPEIHASVFGSAAATEVGVQTPHGILYQVTPGQRVRTPGGTRRREVLHRDEVRFAAPGGITRFNTTAATQKFIKRYMRAFKIALQLVGNPAVYGGDTVRIRRTGSKIIDYPKSEWYASTVRHIFDGTTYQSNIDLRVPPGSVRGKTPKIVPIMVKDLEGAALGLSSAAIAYMKIGS